jgi:hypothetical protein
MNPKWEYTALKLTMDLGFFSGTDFDPAEIAGQLNVLGAEGWELVSTFPAGLLFGETRYVCALLKRRVPEAG